MQHTSWGSPGHPLSCPLIFSCQQTWAWKFPGPGALVLPAAHTFSACIRIVKEAARSQGIQVTQAASSCISGWGLTRMGQDGSGNILDAVPYIKASRLRCRQPQGDRFSMEPRIQHGGHNARVETGTSSSQGRQVSGVWLLLHSCRDPGVFTWWSDSAMCTDFLGAHCALFQPKSQPDLGLLGREILKYSTC